MYFVPRGGRFYAFCVQLNPWQRYALTISVFTGVLFSWYYVVYLPLEDLIASYEHRRTSAQHIVGRAQVVEAKLADQKKQLYRLQGQLQTMLVSYPQQELSSVSVLAGHVHQAGLILHSCRCEGHQDTSWYTNVSLVLDVTGLIHQFLCFFELLTQSNRAYGCSTIELKQMDDEHLFHMRCIVSECMERAQKNPST